jgi:hypothetical protein
MAGLKRNFARAVANRFLPCIEIMALEVSALNLKGVLYGLLQLCETIFMNELEIEIFFV